MDKIQAQTLQNKIKELGFSSSDQKTYRPSSSTATKSLEELITEFNSLFKVSSLEKLIPAMLSEQLVTKIVLTPSSTQGDYTISCYLNISIASKKLKVTFDLQYNYGGTEYHPAIAGAISIAGKKFSIKFKEANAVASILEARYHNEDGPLSLTQLLAELAHDPKLTNDLPNLEIDLKDVVLIMLKGESNKFLFGFDWGIDLNVNFGASDSSFISKLIGGDYGLDSFKFFIASDYFYSKSIFLIRQTRS